MCYQHSVQKPESLMVWGCISVYGMGSLHVSEGTVKAERYEKVLKQHMLPSRQHLFQGKALCISAGQCKTTYCSYYNSMAHSRRVRVLNWPASSPDLSPIEKMCRIIKQKICQRRPQTLQQLKTYIRQ